MNITAFYDRDVDRELLSKIYIETNNHAFFFPELFALNRTGDFNLYALYYYLYVITNIKADVLDDDLYDSVRLFIDTTVSRQNTFEDSLSYLHLLSDIELMLDTQLKQPDFYLEYIMSKFDIENGLFFDTSGEDLNSKIISTLRALRILRNIGTIPDEINNRLYDTLSYCIMYEIDFTFNHAREQAALQTMFGDALSILSILESVIIFNELNSNKTIDLESAREWFISLTNDFLKDANNVQADIWPLNAGLLSIFNVNAHFLLDLDYSGYINHLKSLEWEEILAFDIKTFSDSLTIINRHANFFPEIDDIFNNFRLYLYTQTPIFFFREQYYGFKLANALNLTINNDLFLHTLTEHLSVDSEWFSFNLHYFLLFLQEIDRITDNNSFMYDHFVAYQRNITTDLSTQMSIAEIYRLVYRYYALDMISSLKSDFKETLLERAHHLMKVTGLESSLYQYTLIRLMLGQEVDMDWLESSIKSYFFASQGGFSANNDEQNVNLMSTYRMLHLLVIFNIEFNYISYIPILEYRGQYGGYFLMLEAGAYGIDAYGPGFTLEAWYNGLFIYNIIQAMGEKDEV